MTLRAHLRVTFKGALMALYDKSDLPTVLSKNFFVSQF